MGKQLIPVYDKPMIYYPISTLIHAGVHEILIISSPRDTPNLTKLLGSGDKFGIKISYLEQNEPLGLAHGLAMAENFASGEQFWFILGDNLFHGPDFGSALKHLAISERHTLIFGYRVGDARAYGVINFDEKSDEVESLEEKPVNPRSQWAIPGLYFFPAEATRIAKNVEKSARGEYEIIDVLQYFHRNNRLQVKKVSRGNTWLDMGTASNLLLASNFIETIEKRQGLLVGSPEEASLNSKSITSQELNSILEQRPQSEYYNTLRILNRE
jgi:glucose-1-phosphate thymidylyltransferase